jgi:putative aldouronate transport system permease protein
MDHLRKKLSILKIFCYTAAFVFALFCLFPFIMVISGSLSIEADTLKYGYSLIPKHINFMAYKVMFLTAHKILHAYGITITVTVFGTSAALLINTLAGYSLSLKRLKYRKPISVFILLTILFSGGMVPWYIVCVRYLHLKENILALIIPYLANAWYIFLMRNFMKTIPDEMSESATIDGAKELTIFMRIIVPLSKPALATVGLFIALGYWNDWWLGLMLVNNQDKQPLQMMLRIIVSNIEFIKSNINNSAELQRIVNNIPSEGVKMAVSIITIGPVILFYPFVQKYFVKGIMVGAIKS